MSISRNSTAHARAVAVRKIFWVGRHPTARDAHGHPLTSPLARLTPSVLRWLCTEHGWVQTNPGSAGDHHGEYTLPVFSFVSRRAGQYASCQAVAPFIAQFPIASTEHVDCKIALWRNLVRHGRQACMPPSLLGSDLLDNGEAAESLRARCVAGRHSGLMFVKHRRGVKGQAVHVFDSPEHAADWLNRLPASSVKDDFICQLGVRPLLLRGCRAFTLRLHVLWALGRGGSPDDGLYVHKDCICVEHGGVYSSEASARTAHVSSAAKRTPQPYLLADKYPELYGCVYPQARRIVRGVYECVRDQVAASVFDGVGAGPSASPMARPYYLFGYDFAVDAERAVVLLEVNANPAIASGTLQHVPTQVYDALLQDVIRLIVLPVTDGTAPEPGGFDELT